MKILVTGDRDWRDEAPIYRELSHFPAGTKLVHGDARGVDRIASRIGKELGFEVIPMPADWTMFGKAAGPIRNSQMLKEHPDIEFALAFHSDLENSKGTKDMVKKLKTKNIPFKHITD